jgi:mono/diheme cytochrome c family protein
VCGAPTGIALSEDEQHAWVFCRSTYDLATVKLDLHDGGEQKSKPEPITYARIAQDPISPEVGLGRRLYYNGTEPIVSGGMGCAGCHPEGRDDGHIWLEVTREFTKSPIFVSGPTVLGEEVKPDPEAKGYGFARQTPMLAGRLKAAGPYGWHAQSPDLVARLKEGFALHRWWSSPTDGKTMRDRAEPIIAFAREGLVPPPKRERELTPEEARGKELFLSAATQCATCHVPQTDYTDRIAAPLKHGRPPKNFSPDPNPAFKTPSLLYVGGTPPYFHDGSAATLEDLIEKNNNRMGKTARLSKEDRAALVAFLKTL